MQFLSKILPFNFQLTKNIPIDKRFKVTHISNVDEEIPQGIRYEGLIFIAADDATDYQGNESRFYTFEISKDEQTKGQLVPVLLFDYLNRRVKLGIELEPSEYKQINKILNENCYPVLGTTVYLSPLDIVVQWDGKAWKTICGTIHVSTEAEYTSIESNFKNQGWTVIITDTTGATTLKYIRENLELSDPIITGDTVSGVVYHPGGDSNVSLDDDFWNNNPEKNRLFLIDQTLYYNFEGKLYAIGDEIYVYRKQGEQDSLPTVVESSNLRTLSPLAYLLWGESEDATTSSEVSDILYSTDPSLMEDTEDLSLCTEIECYAKRTNTGDYEYYLRYPNKSIASATTLIIVPNVPMTKLVQHGYGLEVSAPNHSGRID